MGGGLKCSKIVLATFSKVQENSQESEELEAEKTSTDIIFPNHMKKLSSPRRRDREAWPL